MQSLATRIALTFALALTVATPALAAVAPSPGRYEMEWSELDRGQLVDLTNGVRQVDVMAPDPGQVPPDVVAVIQDASTSEDLWHVTDTGRVRPANGLGDGVLQVVSVDELFYIQAEYGSRAETLFLAVGRRVAPTPPPPPATLKVFITQPRAGETVSSTAWVVLWVEGTSGNANTFTLSVNNTQVGAQTTSSRGPVTIPWNTKGVMNGTHTLTGSVRDATGNTGTTSISVIVRNP